MKTVSQINVVKVFAEYKEYLVSYVRKHLSSKDEAEDIVQEIFYQFFRMNEQAKPIEQTAAWLFRVAQNMIINWQKKKKDVPFSALISLENTDNGLNDIVDILCCDEATPETEILRSLAWEEIETALGELPPLQRDIFIQTEFLGLPVKEVSQKTNTPVNTLLSRKHYAVKYLRKKLKELHAEMIGD